MATKCVCVCVFVFVDCTFELILLRFATLYSCFAVHVNAFILNHGLVLYMHDIHCM